MYIKSSCQWAFPPSLFSEINQYFTQLDPPCWRRKHLKLCCPCRCVGKCVITCHHSPLHLFNTEASVNLNRKNRLDGEAALSIPASLSAARWSRRGGLSALSPRRRFLPRSAPFARFTCPTCHSPPPSEREAKFGWNSWLPWQRFVPPQRIGTGTGLSMSVCRQDLGHALC